MSPTPKKMKQKKVRTPDSYELQWEQDRKWDVGNFFAHLASTLRAFWNLIFSITMRQTFVMIQVKNDYVLAIGIHF